MEWAATDLLRRNRDYQYAGLVDLLKWASVSPESLAEGPEADNPVLTSGGQPPAAGIGCVGPLGYLPVEADTRCRGEYVVEGEPP